MGESFFGASGVLPKSSGDMEIRENRDKAETREKRDTGKIQGCLEISKKQDPGKKVSPPAMRRPTSDKSCGEFKIAFKVFFIFLTLEYESSYLGDQFCAKGSFWKHVSGHQRASSDSDL